MLDGDEIVLADEAPLIRQQIDSERAPAYDVICHNYTDQQSLSGWQSTPKRYSPLARGFTGYVPSDFIRVFENHPAIKFSGCIHESILPSLKKLDFNVCKLMVPFHNFGKVRSSARLEEKYKVYEALSKCKLAEAMKGGDSETHAMAVREMAVQYMELGKNDDARKVLETHLNRGEINFHILSMLGMVCEKIGDQGQALNAYQQAAKMMPDDFVTMLNYGNLLTHKGDFSEALIYLEQACKLEPLHWAAQFNLGVCYEKSNRLDESLVCLREAYRSNSNNKTINSLARVLLRNGFYQECQSLIEETGIENSQTDNLKRMARNFIHKTLAPEMEL